MIESYTVVSSIDCIEPRTLVGCCLCIGNHNQQNRLHANAFYWTYLRSANETRDDATDLKSYINMYAIISVYRSTVKTHSPHDCDRNLRWPSKTLCAWTTVPFSPSSPHRPLSLPLRLSVSFLLSLKNLSPRYPSVCTGLSFVSNAVRSAPLIAEVFHSSSHGFHGVANR